MVINYPLIDSHFCFVSFKGILFRNKPIKEMFQGLNLFFAMNILIVFSPIKIFICSF
ncbi:hypothetical protein IGL67_000817 [Enterococcus sp. DIV1390a]